MAEQQPSVGRIVHYVSEGSPVLPDGTQKYASACRAAVVTAVDTDADGEFVDLCVLNPSGMFFDRGAVADEDGKAGGSWHWPERV
jgi:hypothetical protein